MQHSHENDNPRGNTPDVIQVLLAHQCFPRSVMSLSDIAQRKVNLFSNELSLLLKYTWMKRVYKAI